MIPGFDCLALAPTAGPSLPGWGDVLLATASTGLVGMGLSDFASGLGERLSGGDGDDEESSPEDDDLAAGDGGDALGDMDDWDEEDGDLDGLGDDDELGGLGGDGGGQSDLEPRLEDLESEVEKISSTMGTVRSENEAISETVEDIEDNIRKLLDIYEMVTRGVNPFVDEGGGGGGSGISGSFGLFDDAEADEEPDDIDPDVADADPESFFDDDFEEGEIDDDEFDDDEFDDEGFATDMDTSDAADVQGGSGPVAPSRSEANDGSEGKTFDDLKSEYESGSTDWNEDAGSDDERPADRTDDEGSIAEEVDESPTTEPNHEAPTEAGESAPSANDETETDSGTVEEAGRRDEGAHARETDTVGEPADTSRSTEPSSADGQGGGDSAEASEEPNDGHEVSDESRSRTDPSDGKPYLESLPAGYGAELLVVEWLTYLRGRSSTAEALRAIRYYQTIGWIGDAAADSLQRYLTGLADGETSPTTTGGTQLTIDHHTNSLHYIGELGGRHVDVERLEWTRAGSDGGNDERREQRGIQR